ncbi:YphA family membrane protein [Paenibacillus soyae]|uniref:Uncharacterized protein n=1 Tax=Paenibacillus soyae TaxID=2969249 RepID=A0A9X2MLV2_9BACL|nr:hypothetical protein [Paenibacillus soyae]MCR2803034.1 hypothetical protein [Paenibacillus soyae]
MTMIPGYVCALLLLIVSILWATGWKAAFAPRVSTSWTIAVLGIIAILLMFPLWITPIARLAEIKIHAAVCVLLLCGSGSFWRRPAHGQRLYILSCAIMLAIVWGSARSLYSHESMFYFVHPDWDAPLLSGILCGAFTSDIRHQFSIVVWGAAVSEAVQWFLMERGTSPLYLIGEWAWWDGVAVALCAAVLFTAVSRAARTGIVKLGAVWLRQLRGGKS